MRDFEAAKQIARDRWVSRFDDEPGGPHVIHDAECIEYEWGWLIQWGPSHPEQVPPEEARWGWLPVLVDRVTGTLETVSTAGPRLAIIRLLERRPPESRSPDVSAEGVGGLTRVTISMRAFTPLNELLASDSAAEGVELFRLTDTDR